MRKCTNIQVEYNESSPKNILILRPISLLPLPGKILERIICKRLSLFFEHNELLTPQQHGFRKGKFTITSIAALLNSMYDNMRHLVDSDEYIWVPEGAPIGWRHGDLAGWSAGTVAYAAVSCFC